MPAPPPRRRLEQPLARPPRQSQPILFLEDLHQEVDECAHAGAALQALSERDVDRRRIPPRPVAGIGVSWVAIVAPAGTPADRVDRLHREIGRALESPELRASYAAAGRVPVASGPDALRERVVDELPKWREVVGRARIRAD